MTDFRDLGRASLTAAGLLLRRHAGLGRRHRAGERRRRAAAGQRREHRWHVRHRAGDLGRRALRRLRVGRHQPGQGRHERPAGRLRPRPPASARTERVSVAAGGAQADGTSSSPTISADGRFVAFESDAADLVPGEPTSIPTSSSATARPVRPSGSASGRTAVRPSVDGCNGSFDPSISANGRFVAFSSDAINLVPGDTGAWVLLRQRLRPRPQEGQDRAGERAVERLQDDRPSIGPVITPDGRFVAFSRPQPTSSRATPTEAAVRRVRAATGTCSCATGSTAPPSGSASRPKVPRRTRAASSAGYRTTVASSPSNRTPPTSSRATPTATTDVFVRDRKMAPPSG